MTTRNEVHTTINKLIHRMRDMGAAREGYTLTWNHQTSGYWLVWESNTGGQSDIVFLGKGTTSARETAWDMIAVLEAVSRRD